MRKLRDYFTVRVLKKKLKSKRKSNSLKKLVNGEKRVWEKVNNLKILENRKVNLLLVEVVKDQLEEDLLKKVVQSKD